ncbi:DUF2510 domain-containing protein [Subtercola boreus]|uniref:DUF2510 domain-containing protein n=1 Tax=Subtercola boreus TaxID=120213 RepID=UPI0015592CB6|nr:DUF2510 domain-containing protein [Subtercola boreus]
MTDIHDPQGDPNRLPAGAAAPGWYPTAPGSPTFRWWDGVQWTEHLQNQPLVASAAISTVTASTPVYNVFIWLFTLLPIVSLLALIPADLTSTFEQSMRQALANPGSRSYSSAAMLTPGYLLLQLLSFLVWAAMVVLAYFDWKRLGQLGFARRFHWAWGFLTVVYLIGRTVMVRKESGRGLAVIWVYIGLVVVTFVVVGIQLVSVFSAMGQLVQQYR